MLEMPPATMTAAATSVTTRTNCSTCERESCVEKNEHYILDRMPLLTLRDLGAKRAL